MHSNVSAPQSTNRPKNRNPYEVHRVDMSQFLPEMTGPKSNNNKPTLPKTFANSQKTKKTSKPPPISKTQQRSNAMDGFVFRGQQTTINPETNQQNRSQNYTNNLPGKPDAYTSSINIVTSKIIHEQKPFKTLDFERREESDQNSKDQVPIDRMIESGFYQVPEDVNLTPQELQEYRFLQQAQALPITEDSQPVSHILDDNSVRDERIDAINDAIEEIVTNFNEESNIDSLMNALELILSCNIQELKSEVYFTELTEPFCAYILNDMLNFETQLKILPFIIYFCEESMFGLNLDFNKIYNTLNQFIKKVYDGNKETKLSPKVNRVYVDLYKFLSEHLCMMDHSKLMAIFDNFLDMVLYNIQSITIANLTGENKEFIPFLHMIGEFAALYNIFIRKIEIRQITTKEDIIKNKVTTFLNIIGDILAIFEANKLDEKVISIMIQVFNISCLTFKYHEFYNLSETQKYSGETIIIKTLENFNKILLDETFNPQLLDLDTFLDLLKDLTLNMKLYEDKKLDFNKIGNIILESQNLIKGNLYEPLHKVYKRILKYQKHFSNEKEISSQ